MKALEDGVLSSDEIIECQKIIEEINNKISKIKYGNEINNEVKKDLKNEKIEMKKLIKEEFLQNNVLAKLEYEAKLCRL